MNLTHLPETKKSAVPVNVAEKLNAALNRLRPLQRIVLYLRFWENREIAEIARLTRKRWTEIDRLIESTLKELRPMLEKTETNRPKINAA